MDDQIITRAPGANPDVGHCGVVAMASLVGVTVDEGMEWFRTHCNRSARWKGSLRTSEIEKFAEVHGIAYKRIRCDTKKVPAKDGDQVIRRCRLNHFLVHYADPSKTYVVFPTRHVAIYSGGVAFDQGGISHPTEFHCGRSWLRFAWELEALPPKGLKAP